MENGEHVVKKTKIDSTSVKVHDKVNNKLKQNNKLDDKLNQNNKFKQNNKLDDKLKGNNKLGDKLKENNELGNKLNTKKKVLTTKQKPTLVVNKVRKFEKSSNKLNKISDKLNKASKDTAMKSSPLKASVSFGTPKNVKFALKNNSMQGLMDYYKSVRKSPSIPFDSSKQPTKTNLKINSTPSPINPFHKKKLRMKK